MHGILKIAVIKAEGLPTVNKEAAYAFDVGQGPVTSPTRAGAKSSKKRRSKADAISPTAPSTNAAAPSTYVTVAFKDEAHKTSTVEDTTTPVWNADYTFLASDAQPSDDVTFNVFAKKESGTDELLGMNTVRFSTITSGGLQAGVPHKIISPLGQTAGSLYYDTSFTESPPEVTSTDFIDSTIIHKLEGPRPSLLRINCYYGGIKTVYGTVSTLPVVNIFSPYVEGAVEQVLSRTPLKGNPEEGLEPSTSQRVVDSLDKRIEEILTGVDDAVDKKKDEALAGIKHVKDQIKVQSFNIVSGVHGFIGSLFGKAKETAVVAKDTTASAVTSVTDTLGVTEPLQNATHTVQSVAADAVTKVSAVTEQATETAAKTVDQVKQTTVAAAETLKSTAESVKENVVDNAVAAVETVKAKTHFNDQSATATTATTSTY